MRKVVLESKPVLISSRKSTLAGPTIISPAALQEASQAANHDLQISDTLQLKPGASSERPSLHACICLMHHVGLLQGGDLW